MDNKTLAKIELQMLILDILNQKKLEGVRELTVSDLIDELGLEHVPVGYFDDDVIVITDRGLETFEFLKDSVIRSSSVLK
jgi:sulfur carrier protein ThiS